MPASHRYRYPIGLALLCIFILLIWALRYASSIPQRQKEHGEWVAHTYQLLNELALLELHVTQAETGQRGYLLTGDRAYLTPYNLAVERINADMDRISQLCSANPSQQQQLLDIRSDVAAKLSELRQTIALYDNHREKDALDLVVSGAGKQSMERIRASTETLKQGEEAQLQARLVAWNASARQARIFFFVNGAVLFVLIAIVCAAMYSIARQRLSLAAMERRAGAIQQAEAERLSQVVNIQRDIAGYATNLQGAMQVITEHTQALAHAQGAIVEMLEGEEMVYRAGTGVAAGHIGLRLEKANSMSGLCLKENKALICIDSETDPRVDREACGRVGLRSMVVVPLRHDRTAVGVLKVLSAQANAFSQEDVTTLELMAGLLSGTLHDAAVTEALREANSQLEKLATTDGLTELRNHRTFQGLLAREFGLARRHKKPLSLAMLDVDHFKDFNDAFGHPAGDTVLRRVAAILKDAVRSSDYTARYGGEEFALLLPETGPAGAETLAEKVRHTVAAASWDHRDITVSIGVGSLGDAILSPQALIEAADKALYQSKREGRNRVTVASAPNRFYRGSDSRDTAETGSYL